MCKEYNYWKEIRDVLDTPSEFGLWKENLLFTSKPKHRRFPSYYFCTLLLFPLYILPCPVHPTWFSFYSLPSFLDIFTLLSSNNNNNVLRNIVLVLTIRYMCRRKQKIKIIPHVRTKYGVIINHSQWKIGNRDWLRKTALNSKTLYGKISH